VSTRRGFSLIEVVMSLVIFSAVILGLAGLAFQVAKKNTRATDQALVMSVLLSKVDRAATVPFDSLSTLPACDTTISGIVQVRSCTTITALTARVDSIRIDVETTVPGTHPDTIFMRRAKNTVAIPTR
jgi:prepilin-type N-terminal cleavage/methylation domain-containing protein